MKRRDPFITGEFDGRPIGAVSAQDRIAMVRNFDLDQVETALGMQGLQAAVVVALERRQRKLLKAVEAAR